MKELKKLTRNNIANVVKDGNLSAINAGDALRDGYKLRGYIKVENGKMSYWRKQT